MKAKTVLDAVNEFKGEWPYAEWPYICSPKKENTYIPYVAFEKSSGSVNDMWFNVCSKEEFNQCAQECSDNFGAVPDDKPAYTHDSKFEFHENLSEHTITSSNILCCAETGRVVAVFYNENDLQAATGLIKKVELIDGKAYNFKAHKNRNSVDGFYSADEDEFVYLQGTVRSHNALEIKPLTVEVTS